MVNDRFVQSAIGRLTQTLLVFFLVLGGIGSILQIQQNESTPKLRRLTDSGGIHFLENVPSSGISQEPDGPWRCQNGEVLEDPVVVVGTDGSGTRVIAKMLSMLGATVLVEQTVSSQMDVDGRIAGVHFTSPIRNILRHTQSALYEASSPPLPQSVYADGEALMKGFARTMRLNACKAGVGGEKGKMWAFKKPDIMNLLPFLLETFPNMQVLHVVRDGRDMAFSKNTSPLKKYGDALKPSLDTALRASIQKVDPSYLKADKFLDSEKQIAVWAHENEAVAKWGSVHLPRYRWIRIEDFNNAVAPTASASSYYRAMKTLAQSRQMQHIPTQVEVNQVMEELRGKPMGSHDHSKGSQEKQKFGKWMDLATPQEIARLEAIGEFALKGFGYLPGGTMVQGRARL